MEQHPIPQQISSYEFKLVGEMTLKQFLKAGAGIVLGLMVWSTKMFFLIKLPLAFMFGLGGLAMAFLPFQDRPLEVWLRSFVKSIYSPTIFIYKRSKVTNWMGLEDIKESSDVIEEKEETQIPTKEEKKVKEFVMSLPSVKREEEKTTEEIVIKKQATTDNQEAVSRVNTNNAETRKQDEAEEDDWRSKKVDLGLKTQRLGATGKADFGEIPMPDIPEAPNTIVGMVVDKDKRIVEGAIIEVQDEHGNPARVFKTNPLGQFRTSTPLANGKYLVVTEKEGLVFDRVDIEAKGEIVQPIRITATT